MMTLPGQVKTLGAGEAAAAIREGSLKAGDYVGGLISQATAMSGLNAFIAQADEQELMEAARAVDVRRARGECLGALAGIPVSVKDNIDVAGFRTTAAHRALGRLHASHTAPIIAPLASAGALVFGKANMHELSLGATNSNLAFPSARNPYDPQRVPGGSSGGCAVAVAASITPVAVGTDTGASCRLPAALCGVVGFRPSVFDTGKRYPDAGIVPLSISRDTPGLLARTVDDIWLLDALLVGDHSPELPTDGIGVAGLRIGIDRQNHWEHLDPEVERICEAALARLSDCGAVLVERSIPGHAATFDGLGRNLLYGELEFAMKRYLSASQPAVRYEEVVEQASNPDVREVLAAVQAFDPQAYVAAMTVHRPAAKRMYLEYLSSNCLDLIAYPTSRIAAPALREEGSSLSDTVVVGGFRMREFEALTRNPMSMTNAGLCGISLPVGLTRAGLPVGLEFDAACGADQRLLRAAMAIERALGADRGLRR